MYIHGETIRSGLCAGGGMGCSGLCPSRGLLSPWLELGPAWKLVRDYWAWGIAMCDGGCIVRGSGWVTRNYRGGN